MKKIIVLLIFYTCTVYSQTYYMNVWSNGSVTSIPVEDIRKLTFSGITSVEDEKTSETVIKTFTLLQNYPNPFNPSTTIEYEIPNAGDVEIKIYNINGELVKTLLAQQQSAGRYTINWDGKNGYGQTVSSGMYIYRVAFGSSVLAKKMLLIK